MVQWGDIMPMAFVLMKCDKDTENRIIQNLEDSDCITEVQPTIGHYDLVAKFTSPNMDDLNELIEQVQRDDRVRSAKVLLGISEAV